MSRRQVIAAATCMCAIPAAALAAKPPPGTVSIAVTPSTVTFGTPATVAGTTAANTSVTLRADPFPYNGSFTIVSKLTTNAAGAYAFSVTPDRGTHYRVDAKAHPAARSAIAALAVRWRVTRRVSTRHPARGTRVRFSGTVSPAHTGGTAEVQKLKAGVFKTVKTAVLVAATPTSSSYSVRVRIRRDGTYRVRVAGDGPRITGHSRRISLVVH